MVIPVIPATWSQKLQSPIPPCRSSASGLPVTKGSEYVIIPSTIMA